MTINSSNDSVISATAGAGANNISYKFRVDAIAQPAKIESGVIDKEKTAKELLGLNGVDKTFITINGEEIEIKDTDKITDIVSSINSKFSDGSVKAVYSEMTGKFSIETKATGENAKLTFKGDLFDQIGMVSNEIDDKGNPLVKGSNTDITVFDSNGKEIKKIKSESNSITIDNITYNVKSTSSEVVSMNSEKDTKKIVENVQSFIKDYNSMIDKIYNLVTEKKNNDYPPLTEAQKEEMKEEEIEKWEKKATAGMLRNDSELRGFMEGIKSAVYGSIGNLGVSLSDIGIVSVSDYNKPGQLSLDVDKFTKALEDNSDLVYKATTTAFEKIKDVTYKYAGSSSGLFVKKAGQDGTSTSVNNIYSNEIKKYEEKIKELNNKMKDKENNLYKKFASLENSMNKFNSQMTYLMSYMAQ